MYVSAGRTNTIFNRRYIFFWSFFRFVPSFLANGLEEGLKDVDYKKALKYLLGNKPARSVTAVGVLSSALTCHAHVE